MLYKKTILAILAASTTGFSNGFTIVENRSNGGLLNAMKDQSMSEPSSRPMTTSAHEGTLPSFRTANGLLSPQTVYRMKQSIMRNGGVVDNESIATFLETYERDGPMSCLSMLSDSNVLPHLTKAMRDLA